MNDVQAIFEPKSVVLIGSTKVHEKVGMASPELFSDVIYNMRKYYKGKVFVIDVDGKRGYSSVEDLRETPQLAVLMLPPQQSIPEAEKCAQKGVKGFVVITGGFKDKERRKLLELKEKYGARILGPNTIMGVINTSNGLNTTFERNAMPRKGNIAVISQSGGVGASLIDWVCSYDVGVSKFAFMGDKIDVDDVDLLRYLGADKRTCVICIYMEGIRSGQRFLEEAREITRQKPILVLKGGATEESAHRAKSHTASIAGSDAVYDAAFKKAGIIRVQDVEELTDMAVALAKQPPMRGDNVAVVSNVGGPAILAADAVAREQLKLAPLSDASKREIERLYPGMDAANPIDMIADARADRFEKVLEIVLADRKVDGVLVINMLKSTFFEPQDSRVISKVAGEHRRKPIVDVCVGGDDFVKVRKVLARTSVPVFNLPEKGVKALKVLRSYGLIVEKR